MFDLLQSGADNISDLPIFAPDHPKHTSQVLIWTIVFFGGIYGFWFMRKYYPNAALTKFVTALVLIVTFPLWVLPAFYFLGGIIAWRRNHPNATAIIVLNLLLGWSILGWVGSIVWSLTNNHNQARIA